MRYFALVSFILFTFLVAPFAHAQEVRPYFTETTLPASLLTPPLKPHSPEWNAEVDQILALQKNPDAKEVAKAADERKMSPEMVALAVEPKWTRAEFPASYRLLDRVSKTTYIVGDAAKNYFNTKRPYLMDSRIKTLIEPHDNPAYPSGHTMGSLVWAQVCALLLPEQQASFIARADEIAQHRVLVGMHWPHDVRGGRELAFLVTGGLLQNAEFNVDLQAARDELEAKGLRKK